MMDQSKLIEAELVRLVSHIVDIITDEHKLIEAELLLWKMKPHDLDRMANLAELKIKSKQIKNLKKKILSVIKTSTNKLIISSIKMEEN